MKRRNIKNEEDSIKNSINKGINILNEYKQKKQAERNERIGKTFDEYNEEKKSKENVKPLIFSFMIIIIIFALYMFMEYSTVIGLNYSKKINLEDNKKISITNDEGVICKSYGKKLVVYYNQLVSVYSKDMKEIFNFKLPEAFTPDIYTNENYMIVSNSANGKIYMFENKNEILEKKIDGTIEKIYIDKTGDFALEYSTSGHKKVLGVFNKAGKNIYNAYLENNPIIALEFITSKKIIIAQAMTNSLTVGISLKQIDGNKSNENIEEILKLDNAMIYNLKVINKNILITSNEQVLKYNMDSKKTDIIRDFSKIQLNHIDVSDNYLTLVEEEIQNNTQNYSLKSLRFDGEQIGISSLEGMPKIIQNSGILTYVIYQHKIEIINKWGINVKSINIQIPPREILPFNNEKSLALIYSNYVYIVNL